jgi:hypothetical protein
MQDPTRKIARRKKDWGCGSSVEHLFSKHEPEFKPQNCQKKKKVLNYLGWLCNSGNLLNPLNSTVCELCLNKAFFFF